MRPRQVETNPLAKTDLFLSQEIGVFFSDALRLELSRSGYTMNDSSDRFVSGTITRFYLDWRSGEDRSFELAVDYTIQSSERSSSPGTALRFKEGRACCPKTGS